MNRLLSLWCFLFLKPLIGWTFIKEVRGKENIPQRNFILAANHQSHFDQIVTGYICVPRRFHMIGQIDKYEGISGFLRDFLYFLAGTIPVNRKDKESKRKALLKAIEVLKKGDILIIYPEGTRSRTGRIQEGKLGVARIYLKTEVPILPVGIKGTFELLPPGRVFPKIKKAIIINIGKPLFFKEYLEEAKNLECTSPGYQEICKKITEEVMGEIKNLVYDKKNSHC